jgi:hypothetical protein
VDPVIACGEPLTWSDFAPDPIPDDQNAAVLYRQAVVSSPFGEYPPVVGEYPRMINPEALSTEMTRADVLLSTLGDFQGKLHIFHREHPEEVRELLDMSKDVFVLCRKARRLDKVDWGIDYTGWAFESGIPPCDRLRTITELLSLAAIDAHKAGRDDEAIEYVRDGMALGDSMSTVPNTITYLVTISIYSIISQPLEEILPGLKIGDAPGGVPAGALRSLRSDFLDATRCYRGLRLAMMSERSMMYDTGQRMMNMEIPGEQTKIGHYGGVSLDTIRSDDTWRRGFDFCVAPLWRIETARAVSFLDAYVNLSNARTLPEFRRGVPQMHDCSEHVFPRVLSCMLLPTTDRTFVLNFQTVHNRQMAGIAIAIRMYQVNHGRLPDTLAQLVPDYLSEVPQDSMAEPGNPIRYINDPDTPRLYSVGEDGRDDGGDYEALDEECHVRKDKFFFLNGRPAMPERKSDSDDEDGDE